MPEVKVSKAARELAIKMNHESLLHGDFIPEAAEVIQSALHDLLEKAEAVSDHAPGENQLRNVVRYLRLITELKSALEPWKAGE